MCRAVRSGSVTSPCRSIDWRAKTLIVTHRYRVRQVLNLPDIWADPDHGRGE
jgi:hypothetical protein